MRPAAARLLNAAPGAVIVVSTLTFLAVPTAASAAPAPAPVPYVVAIDPGHGGSPDNNRPELQFDPGSIAGNGLAEKDLTLDVARKVQQRLAAEQVRVVMTRTGDQFVSIPDRMTTAANAGAQLFVSIHFNFFQDPSVGGSLILYPRDSDMAFAQLMSNALGTGLAPYNVGNNGLVLRDNLWVHAPMPTVTVEAAYLTNKNEADLLTRDTFRTAIANSIITGIQAQAPVIKVREAEILKYRAAHAVRAAAPRPVALPSFSFPRVPNVPVVKLALLAAMAYLALRFRRAAIPALALAIAAGAVMQARASGRQPEFRTRRGVRRRRSRAPLWKGARTF